MLGPTFRILRRVIILAAAGVGAGCSDRSLPSGPTLSPGVSGRLLTCAADVRAQTLSCTTPTTGASGAKLSADLILGGQGIYVRLASSNVSYDATAQIFKADVTVQNLTALTLGTPDGSTVTGLKVFFYTGPSVVSGTGTVTVSNADGTATFTGTNQPYFLYNQILQTGQVSSARTWQWAVPVTVETFTFQVFVDAAAPSSLGTWSPKASMPTPRAGPTVGTINGVLYVAGGTSITGTGTALATLEAYDPAADAWSAQAPMFTGRESPTAGVINGVLYVAGGWGSGGQAAGAIATVEAYDPATNTWTSKAPMPTARGAATAGVINGLLYVAGGAISGSALTTLEAYDPATNTWTSRAPMPTARYGAAADVVNGVLYVAGGVSGNAALATLEAYDPITNTWTSKAPMPTARAAPAAGVINGILYVAGGLSGSALSTLEAYDPASNTWSSKAPMPTARGEPAAGVINGVLYVAGGQTTSSNSSGLAILDAFTQVALASPWFDVQDGVHSGGNAHFYFLPPMVPAPSYSGTSDPTQSPQITVCEWVTSGPNGACGPIVAFFSTSFGTGSGVVLYDPSSQAYSVDWYTAQCLFGTCTLDPTKPYRLSVLVGALELGHADVFVVSPTLPVRFRIEQGAVTVVAPGTASSIGPTGGNVVTSDGHVALAVPTGALAAATNVTVAGATSVPAGSGAWSAPVDLGPTGTTFSAPAMLTLSYDPTKLPSGVAPSALQVYTADATGWKLAPGGTLNAADNTVTVPISHLSTYTLTVAPTLVSGVPSPAMINVGQVTMLTGYLFTYQVVPIQFCYVWFGVYRCSTYTNTYRYPVANQAVAWSALPIGTPVVSLDSAVTYTDPGGATTSPPIRGRTPGTAQIVASSGPVQSSPDMITVTAATTLAITTPPSSNAQSGVPLAQQPALQVQDANGNAVSQSGVVVTVGIASAPSGTQIGIVGGTATTGANGVATFSGLTLSGPTVTLTLSFSATGLTSATSGPIALGAPAAAIAANSPTSQSATAGTVVASAPSVILRDASGNPVPGVAVTYAVTSGGGTVVPTTPVMTGADGTAAVTSWALGPATGTNTLTATAAGNGIAGNPVTFTATGMPGWVAVAPLPMPASRLGAGVANGFLYAIGGVQGLIGPSLPTVEAFAPGGNTWTARALTLPPRGELAVGVVNGVLYTVGGVLYDGTGGASILDTVEAYAPLMDSWRAEASLPTPRRLLAVGVVNNTPYAVGGADLSGNASGLVEAYDPITNSWTEKAPLPTARYGLAVGVVNGLLYAVGGINGGQFLSAVEAYDPLSDSWRTEAALPAPVAYLAVGVVNNTLYAVGGDDQFGNASGLVEAYDPIANSWTEKAPLPTPRYGLAVGVVNGLLYAVGGINASAGGTLPTVEAYHP